MLLAILGKSNDMVGREGQEIILTLKEYEKLRNL
jgi:hypothetical protein